MQVTRSESLLCDACFDKNRHLSVLYCSDYYHECADPGSAVATLSSSGSLVVTAVLNSGIQGISALEVGEVDTWDPTLAMLVAEGTPTIVTAHHRAEARTVHRLLTSKHNANIIMAPQANPYAGLVPQREPDPTAARGDRLYYDNQFVLAFRGARTAGQKSGEAEAAAGESQDDAAARGGTLPHDSPEPLTSTPAAEVERLRNIGAHPPPPLGANRREDEGERDEGQTVCGE